MCAVTFWLLLVFHGKAKLLAVSIALAAWVEINKVGRCGLNMWVKYYYILQPLKIVPNYLKKNVVVIEVARF